MVDLTNFHGVRPQLLLFYHHDPPRGIIEEVARVYTYDEPPNDLHLECTLKCAGLTGRYYVLSTCRQASIPIRSIPSRSATHEQMRYPVSCRVVVRWISGGAGGMKPLLFTLTSLVVRCHR